MSEAKKPDSAPDPAARKDEAPAGVGETPVPETGGRNGPDPTRYGDWEKNGRCVDF